MSNPSLSHISFQSLFEDIEYDTYDTGMAPRSLLELNIMNISATIRLKPEWYKKVFDANILAKWRKELQGKAIFHDKPITAEIIDYIFDELQWKAKQMADGIIESPVDRYL